MYKDFVFTDEFVDVVRKTDLCSVMTSHKLTLTQFSEVNAKIKQAWPQGSRLLTLLYYIPLYSIKLTLCKVLWELFFFNVNLSIFTLTFFIIFVYSLNSILQSVTAFSITFCLFSVNLRWAT